MNEDADSSSPKTDAESASKALGMARIQRVPRIGGAETRSATEGPNDGRVAELHHLMDNVKELTERIAGTFVQEIAPKPTVRDKSVNRTKTSAKTVRLGAAPAIYRATQTQTQRTAPLPPRRKSSKKRKVPLLLWVAAQTFGFGLIALGYFLGQTGVSPADAESKSSALSEGNFAAAAKGSAALSHRSFQQVNLLMDAGKKGDAATSKRLLEEAQREGMELPGSDYRLALLALQRGDLPEAKLRLNCAVAANQQIAACAYVQAMLAGAAGDYNLVAQEMAGASYAEPFSARYLFFWGEALRRAGKAKDAVERLEQALLRPCDARDAEYIAFKLRLAKIEAGRGEEIAGELTEKLQAKNVSAAWLLTAAAREKSRGDDAAASRFLQEAAHNAAPEDLGQQLRDFFFAVQFPREETTAYLIKAKASLRANSSGVTAINADPAYWTIQAADPGAWPSL